MTPGTQDEQDGAQAIDPISRQILKRTTTQNKVPQALHNVSASMTSAPHDETSDRRSADAESLRRTDTGVSSRPHKDKKKGVSFLSRIMGGKKKDDTGDVRDSVSEISENRWGGNDAEVFSQPVGFIPKFPAPPRYIRVKAQNRRKRDLDRLFLSQILLEPPSSRSRKSSNEVDAKIVNIGDTPAVPPPNSSRKTNNAIWAAEFSKDGRYFAAAGQDKILRVWEVISDRDTKDANEGQSETGSDSSQSVKLNAPVFKQKLVREYDGHTAAILDLSWSKNNFLLSSSMDKSVRLYHVSREECLCSFKHNDFVTSIQFHPRDDRFFLAGSLDSKLRLWSIPDKNVAYWAQVPDMITAVAFTPDGKTAIAGCLSGLCILYNTDGLKAHSQIHVRSTRGRNTKGSKITGIDTIAMPREHGPPDVKLLITSNDSRIRLYNLKDRALETKFRGNENACSQIRATFSHDGKFVICGSEDRKVYIWPTGPVEKADIDKRPVEIFEAHSQIVTTALFAPINARRLLAQSGDPIYDLCNPPPVVLLSRTDSMLSSPANTNRSAPSDEQPKVTLASGGAESPRAPETPAYQARHAHHGGHVIVTADYSGQIKVFRQDCAYQKRRDSNWDAGSTLSRKMTMLGRSGSITPRTSVGSSNHRNSMQFPVKSPSNDRIMNWRDSISSSPGNGSVASDYSFKRAKDDHDQSSSPKKTIGQRLSLRYTHTPLSNTSSASPSKTRQPSATPDITLQAPDATNSQPYRSNTGDTEYGSVRRTDTPGTESNSKSTSNAPSKNPAEDENDNPLVLIDNQSFMAWDVQNTIVPMMNAKPRSPGFLHTNPMSRTQSIVSQLSSDLGSHSEISDDNNQTRHDMGSRKISTATNGDGSTDGEELKCKICGGEKFKMVKSNSGGRGLKCRSCSTTV